MSFPSLRFSPSRSRMLRRWAVAGLVGTALSAGAIALAQGRHGPGPRGMDSLSMAERPEHLARMLDRMLEGVDATDAQRSQVHQIAQAAAVDLKAQRDAGLALRKQGVQLFTAPVVDANAVEALRQQQLARHDAVSRRISQSLVEISRVLTPEQREKLAHRFSSRLEKMGQHRHG